MARVRYNLFHQLGQNLASTRPMAWFYARTLHHCDRLFFALSGGRVNMTSLVAGLPMIMVHTVGRKSGKVRNIPLVAIPDDKHPGSYGIIGTNYGQKHHPAWYHNLKAHPRVTCTVAGRKGGYVAREAESETYDRLWQRAEEIYVGYPLYKQRIRSRRIPIMVLSPE